MSVAMYDGRLLARNAALNAGGQLLPLLLALPLVPYVLHALGSERFAVLTLAWTVIGYFGFLDLGLGRAATKFAAGVLGAGRADEVNRVVWSSLAMQALLGLAGAAVVVALATVLARDVLGIGDAVLLAETRTTLKYVALGLPLVLLSGSMSGVLEAYQRFDLVNLVRVPANIATLLVPAAGATLGWSLPGIVAGIVAARAIALLCFAGLAGRVADGFRPVWPHWPTLRMLLGFGGWLTISLIAVPILIYVERLLIGGLRSLTELAYYAVAFEIVARSAVIPSAIALTLFPAFSYAQRSGGSVDELFRRPLRMLFLLAWPLLLAFWLFSGEILHVWVGIEIAEAGSSALRLLALAFFLNGFAQLALAGIQGLGRPDLKAKLDLWQVPVFIGLAALLIARFGITGAAAAKLIVTLIDTVVLFIFARRLGAPPLLGWSWLRGHLANAGAVLLLLTLVATAINAPLRVRVIVALAAVFLVEGTFWRHALEPADRAFVRGIFSRILTMKEVTP